MARKSISEEETVELKRLYKEHVAAVNRAGVNPCLERRGLS